MTIKDYFIRFMYGLTNDIDLDKLTELFTDLPYIETKPYLIRRQIIPIDKRFSQIEIVYDDSKKIRAISWDFVVRLSELENIFGGFLLQNLPYDNSTEFAFKSDNSFIDIIKTRFPSWLERIDGLNFIERNFEDKIQNKIFDPEFNFVQISIIDK